VGQRKGLGVAAAEPLYVSRLDKAANTLVVGTGSEARRRAFIVARLSWTCEAQAGSDASRAIENPEVRVSIRHRGRLAAASLSPLPGGRLRVVLREGERGIAPGQAAVFYSCVESSRLGDEVIGGGTIEEVL